MDKGMAASDGKAASTYEDSLCRRRPKQTFEDRLDGAKMLANPAD